ncbi:MAG: MATE family efflux transporter, partial [Muribaculaceae bacterium]|nr:MATE family efflux transporter [Muribaculaceae bacterium]
MSRTSLQRLKIWEAYKAEYKTLLRLGLPVLVTQLGIIVVSFADTMMVGMYGTKELAAAAFVNNFFMVGIVMLIGFASGVTPLVGALYSQKKDIEVGRTLRVTTHLN